MELGNQLRELLRAYTSTQSYKLDIGCKATVAAIHLSISLYELGELRHRPVSKEEEHWFNGSYTITREFDSNEWDSIPKLYDEMVSIVKKKNFFRS